MARSTLRRRAIDAHELMDDPDCDPVLLARTYDQFRIVNSLVSGWHGIYRDRIRPLLSPMLPSTLLDIGCGGGDIARALARWAAADGLQLQVTGIDPDARALEFARRTPNPDGVRFLLAESSELVDAAQRFDFVISNHVLHHLSSEQLADLQIDSELLCRGLALHGDIRRSAVAYGAFSAGTLPFFRRSYIRVDGLTSIRRSYTTAELRVAARRGWTVEALFPFRNLLSYAASSAARSGGPEPDA
ncbi:class I SAM-dependent methyltransferase [Herbiconiux sp. CPCC 205763]|uniref:Class I SAM-dependent methyltransferase n=1 Tax=Herbiconiux aconitum TaxID=2970913 RepID=A0ABT2GTV8_9MICO|nr:class I SAM-dependent methyltransferase [Herbiconiux aconitum]MCS5719647.1 class I SAM-dependent methyltransferase [Herbiconiux aconitum]